MPASRIAPKRLDDSPERASGEADILRRAEVRDVLAWVRLLVDPHDAAAVVRALARPPVELRQVHLARVIQLARRRKVDLVTGLAGAIESPQLPPEACERIGRFIELHRSARIELQSAPADQFMAALIELLGTRGRPLLAPQDAAEQRASLERLVMLAADYVRDQPRSSVRDFARHLAALAPQARTEGSAASSAEPPADPLAEAFQVLREEVLESVTQIGGRLGELRLDTELDIAHGVVRYLELVKLAALLQLPSGQGAAESIADINARLLAATTPVQREIFQTSTLDDALIEAADGGPRHDAELAPQGAALEDRALARAVGLGSRIGAREEHSLGPFLPRKGIGLALSASDIETYRSCPLRYKFARVLRIPTEQTLHQRFGIVVHQVLERFHSDGGQTLAQMLDLLDAGWRRAGFGESAQESELREKGRAALTRYHERLLTDPSQPVWFERSFSFRLGPHHLRGRVDRVDRVAGAAGEEYELIDYKTSRPKTAAQLSNDVQLSLYALAAREAWQLESSRQAYYYVLDDRKVPLPSSEGAGGAVREMVLEVGEGILAQRFEPTPSHATCSICDYRIVCPVAER